MDIISSIQETLDSFRKEYTDGQQNLQMSYISITELNDKSDKKYAKILQDTKMSRFLRTHNRKALEPEPSLAEYPLEHYGRPWCKLTKEQKINRLMDYSKRLKKRLNLSDDNEKQLSCLFLNSVNSGLLGRKEDVEYSPQETRILKIYGLKKEGDIFYLQDEGSGDHRNAKSLITETFVPLNLSNLSNLSNTVQSVSPIVGSSMELEGEISSEKKKIAIKKKPLLQPLQK